MRYLAVTGLVLVLSGCQTDRPEAPLPMPDAQSCGAEALLPLIGRDLTSLPASGGWQTLRVIRPGMAVTEDYSPTRLNVTLGEDDRITGLTCG